MSLEGVFVRQGLGPSRSVLATGSAQRTEETASLPNLGTPSPVQPEAMIEALRTRPLRNPIIPLRSFWHPDLGPRYRK